MSTTTEHIAARDDDDLTRRLVAAAEQAGVPDASMRVAQSLARLVSETITVHGEETTITRVHAYAADVRAQHLADSRALPPGLNPGAVTDDHLRAAIQAVLVDGTA